MVAALGCKEVVVMAGGGEVTRATEEVTGVMVAVDMVEAMTEAMVEVDMAEVMVMVAMAVDMTGDMEEVVWEVVR